jgi:hypothetical protein
MVSYLFETVLKVIYRVLSDACVQDSSLWIFFGLFGFLDFLMSLEGIKKTV